MRKKGILLVNLGTPVSPAVKHVRQYLNEFLMDGRVITMHPVLRALLVKGIIVPFRAANSARLYRQIWDENTSSPLAYYSQLQKVLLQLELGDDYHVELAMRYQDPGMEQTLEKLKSAESIKVIPLFPQYASATTGSVHQKVMEIVSRWQTIPKIELINSFHDHPLMISAIAEKGKKYDIDTYDHVLFSFHGLPQSHLISADNSRSHCQKAANCCKTLTHTNKFCYGAQCYHTAQLIAGRLNIPEEKYTVCFQSRLGRSPWLNPYTSQVITDLAKIGKKRILVFCPAFVADCLETIHEISVEYRELFMHAGGEELQLVESLNDSPMFIRALRVIASG